jgi:hypothetical protein
VAQSRWRGVLFVLFLAFLVLIALRVARGAVVRDFVAPMVIALGLVGTGSGFLAHTVPGWPRVGLGAWVSAWLRFLGVIAFGLLVATALFLALGAAWTRRFDWTLGPAVLRVPLLGMGGALLLAVLGRVAARPPKPLPSSSSSR